MLVSISYHYLKPMKLAPLGIIYIKNI